MGSMEAIAKETELSKAAATVPPFSAGTAFKPAVNMKK